MPSAVTSAAATSTGEASAGRAFDLRYLLDDDNKIAHEQVIFFAGS